MKEEVILVTGASGFLGSTLGRELYRKGYPVRGLVRGTSSVPTGVEAVVGSGLLDSDSLRRGLTGAGTVIHLAARVHVLRETEADPMAAYRAANVEGTRTLVREAVRAGVRRMIFVSSVKAVTGESVVERLDPKTVPNPNDPYGVTKLEGERIVWEEGAPHIPDVAVVRLPAVYGPGMRGNLLRLFRLLDAGIPLPVGTPGNQRSVLYVGNFTEAVKRCLEVTGWSGTHYLRDSQDVSTAELARKISLALGKRPRLVPLPASAFAALGRGGDGIARLLGLDSRPSVAVERLIGSLRVDDSSFRELFRFEPPFSTWEGLESTARWYRGSKAEP